MQDIDLVAEAKALAEKEYLEEKRRTLVDIEKMRLQKRELIRFSWFPWKISIQRRDYVIVGDMQWLKDRGWHIRKYYGSNDTFIVSDKPFEGGGK